MSSPATENKHGESPYLQGYFNMISTHGSCLWTLSQSSQNKSKIDMCCITMSFTVFQSAVFQTAYFYFNDIFL